MVRITFVISYHQGVAGEGHLDFYDASVSLQGFAKAISITTHALLNDGEIRKKGHRIEGAKLFLEPSKRGSFDQFATLVVTNQEAIGTSIAAAAFWDLVKWTWSNTIGSVSNPETPFVRRLVESERVEPFIGEIEEALEVPLEQAHRPIRSDSEVVIALRRQRAGEVIRFDANSLASVSAHEEPQPTTGIVGNVTRYNILSGYGRFYDNGLSKTVSFKVSDEVSSVKKSLLTWSLHHAQREVGAGKVRIDAKRVLTSRGNIKRYLVTEIERA
jgi:hypothetical protein